MRTVKVGNTVVKIYEWKGKSGYEQFKVAYRADGQRKRETFGSLAKAKARANEVAVQIERGERDALKLTNADRSTYLHALELLKPTSIPLHVAIQEYLSLRKPTECPQKLVPDVVAQLLEDKKIHGASLRHVQTLRRRDTADAGDRSGPTRRARSREGQRAITSPGIPSNRSR
jgi:hypothetical protein